MAEDELDDIVEYRTMLTDYERNCFRSLRRLAMLVLMCFLINVGLIFYKNLEGLSGNDTLLQIASCGPMLPQFILSQRIARTGEGLKPVTLGWFQLCLMFFMLVELVRLYSMNNNPHCGLSPAAFTDRSKMPVEVDCNSYVVGPANVTMTLYLVVTLFQLAAINKLILEFRMRCRKRQIERRGINTDALLEGFQMQVRVVCVCVWGANECSRWRR